MEERQRLTDHDASLRERLSNISEAIDRREARLYELKDLGDVEKIRKQRENAKEALRVAELQLEARKRDQRDLLKAEELLMGSHRRHFGKGSWSTSRTR